MKTLRRYAIPVLALPVLCAVAAAVVMYRLGWYDISFIERMPNDAYVFNDDNKPAGDGYSDDYTETKIESNNLSGVFDPERLDGISQSGSSETAAPSSSPQKNEVSRISTVTELKAAGYAWTETAYNKSTHRIGQVTGGIPLTKRITVRDGRKVLQVYMGYIIYDDGTHISALGTNGVVSVAGIDNLTPAYMRDSEGHPLFTYNDRYYYLVNNSNQMAEVGYDPLYAPPLRYDSPAAYSINKGDLQRYYVQTVHQRKIDADGNDVTGKVDNILSEALKNGKDIEDAAVYAKLHVPEYTLQYRDCILWGYLNSNGGIAIEAQYYFASDFNENGIAEVADVNGRIKLINRRGSTVADPSGTTIYLTERNRRPAAESYYLPQTFGIESIGMFTFDHGLTRVRSCIYDYYKEGELVRDKDILIQKDGTVFEIPQDYTLKGYSDGVMLLEKDGYYGFLDYTGRWIAQPIYTFAQPFAEGLAVIGFSAGKLCMIDTEGNIVLPFIYDYISNVSSGVVVAYSDDGWSIFNKMSK
jgi:hypothetical protein